MAWRVIAISFRRFDNCRKTWKCPWEAHFDVLRILKRWKRPHELPGLTIPVLSFFSFPRFIFHLCRLPHPCPEPAPWPRLLSRRSLTPDRDSLLTQYPGRFHSQHGRVRRRWVPSSSLLALSIPTRAGFPRDERELQFPGAVSTSGGAAMTAKLQCSSAQYIRIRYAMIAVSGER